LAAEPEGRWRLPLGMITIPASRQLAPRSENPMAKGKKKLEVIHLVCEETGDQNYTLRRKTGGEKLKVKKYSPRLRKHTVHNEKRK
jgi:large subunit ribosomal protein L33